MICQKSWKYSFDYFKFILILIILFFYLATSGYALNVAFQWDKNTDPDIAGYRVFCREKGQTYDYTNPSWEGSNTACTIYNLDETKSYYFVSRSFNTNGLESVDSNELFLEAATTTNNQPPKAIVTQDYIEASPGLTVTLDGSNSTDTDDGIASYLWTQMDGTPVTLFDHNSELSSFIAPETDQYGSNLTFQLTVTDFGGLQSTAICLVYVSSNESNNPPIAYFSYDYDKKVEAFMDLSNDNDGTIASWFWDFGDGDTSSEQNPDHRYSKFGNYTVTLTVTDDRGASDSISKNITVTK